jgi:glutamate dehydrogenase (NAD(P)+)
VALVVPRAVTNPLDAAVAQFMTAWVRDLQFFFWEETEVRERLQRAITGTYREVSALAQKAKSSLREAAMLAAVFRVMEAALVRGIYP